MGASARGAHDDQGILRRRGPADHVGRAGLRQERRDEERGRRRPPARRRRRALRQDQRAALSRRLAKLQRDLRHHEQPVGRRARARRILGRLRGGARGRAHRARGRERHRLVDPQPGALLRRLRPQADLGHRAAYRPGAALANHGRRHRRGGSARAKRRRPRAGAVGHGRPRRDRGGGMAAAARAATAAAAARLQGGPDARRARHRRGSRGAGPAPDPGRLSEPAEGEGRRSRAPGHRSRRGVRRLHAAPARRNVRPPERRGLRAERGDRARPRGRRSELLRARHARRGPIASRLARGERDAPPHAPRVGRVLHDPRPAPVPGRRRGGLPARSEG